MGNLFDAMKHLSQQDMDSYKKEVFNKLVKFVESGKVFDSENLKFVCRHWDLGGAETVLKWRLATGKDKSASAFRSQKSSAGKQLESVLGMSGDQLLELFTSKQKSEVESFSCRIDDLIVYFDIYSNKHPLELFQSDFVSKFMPSEKSSDKFPLEKCNSEIVMLRCLSKQAIENAYYNVDSTKMCYLIRVMREPAFEGKEFNEDRFELMRLLDKFMYGDFDFLEKRTRKYEIDEGIAVDPNFKLENQSLMQALISEKRKPHLPPKSVVRDDEKILSAIVDIAKGNYEQGVQALTKLVDFSYLNADSLFDE